MNDPIEKIVEEFREKYTCSCGIKNDGCDHFDDMPGGLDDASDWLRTALNKAKEIGRKFIPPSVDDNEAGPRYSRLRERQAWADGWNACRESIFTALSKLESNKE